MSQRTIEYHATPTLSAFHHSDAFIRGIRGPVGSGKSTACSWEIMRRAREQRPALDGRRHTRWAIIRNSYPELKDTTLKTWLDWFPEEIFGHLNRQSMIHHIQMDDLDCEVMFRALDRPDDIKKVLSLELTGAWINEARELPKSIVDALGDRTGRFPSMRSGGPSWRGLIMDTNAPDSDHWWYRLSEEDRPKNWAFFNQPGGVIEKEGEWVLNPKAENLDNLEKDYYLTRVGGKTRDYISVYYGNIYGFVRDGKPVYPEYFDATHALEGVFPCPTAPLYVGLSFGLTPAAVLAQRTPAGAWTLLDELISDDFGMVRFAEQLGTILRRDYADYKIEIWGDPSGDDRRGNEERTVYDILKAHKIDARPATTEDLTVRREAVAGALAKMVEGKPAFAVGPKCKTLRKAMAGGYCYRRIQISGEERYHDVPEKNRYAHVAEACQYLFVGAGEGATLLGKSTQWAPLKYPKSSSVV